MAKDEPDEELALQEVPATEDGGATEEITSLMNDLTDTPPLDPNQPSYEFSDGVYIPMPAILEALKMGEGQCDARSHDIGKITLATREEMKSMGHIPKDDDGHVIPEEKRDDVLFNDLMIEAICHAALRFLSNDRRVPVEARNIIRETLEHTPVQPEGYVATQGATALEAAKFEDSEDMLEDLPIDRARLISPTLKLMFAMNGYLGDEIQYAFQKDDVPDDADGTPETPLAMA